MRLVFTSCILLCVVMTGCGEGEPRVPGACALEDVIEARGFTPREPIYRFLNEGTMKTADELVDGEWQIPRFEAVSQGPDPSWTIDPFDEKYWRFIYYSLRHTRHLIYAYNETGAPRYAEALSRIVRGYLESDVLESEALEDPHTVAFASMMVTHITQSLTRWGYADGELQAQALEAVVRLNCFLLRDENFERDNNHGITEAAALVYSASVFDTPGARRWSQVGNARLREVIDLTVDRDGAQVEQSPFYHFYSLKFFWQINQWAEENGSTIDPRFQSKVGQMVDFGSWFILPDGTLPLLGATLSHSIRQSGDRELYDEMGATSPKFEWFLTGGETGAAPRDRSVVFETAGFAIARSMEEPATGLEWLYSGAGEGGESHLIMDVGPYRTAHSDLDALSVFFFAKGAPILVDSGLYSLEASSTQAYFRSTRAHNTVALGERNQQVGSATERLHLGGDFWSYFSGEHRLYGDPRHVRGVVLLGDNTLVVVDRVDGASTEEVSQVWNFPPSAVVGEAEGNKLLVRDGERQVEVTTSNTTLAVAREGETSPRIDGWHSTEYEEKSPAHSIYLRRESDASYMVTVFSTEPRNRVQILENRGQLLRVLVGRSGVGEVLFELRNLGETGESFAIEAN